MSKKITDLTYEEAMDELKTIVQELQEATVSIDDLSEKSKRAATLMKYCREKLRKTEDELKGLFED